MSHQSRGLVMLVDDDLTIAEMYCQGLLHEGFTARAFSNADALLKAIDLKIPDVVILDWDLHGMTGGDICRLLRRDARVHQTAIIFLSDYSGDYMDLERQVKDLGAEDWLVKAKTSPSVLARHVRDVISLPGSEAS